MASKPNAINIKKNEKNPKPTRAYISAYVHTDAYNNGNINIKKIQRTPCRIIYRVRSHLSVAESARFVYTRPPHMVLVCSYVRRLNAHTYEYNINRFRVVRLVKTEIKKKKNRTG